MNLKKILVNVFMLFLFFSCSNNNIILLNDNGNVSIEYAKKMNNKINKIAVKKIKEKNIIEVKKFIDGIFDIDLETEEIQKKLEGLEYKFDNNDLKKIKDGIIDIVKEYISFFETDIQSISYISENEVDVFYKTKIPNILLLEENKDSIIKIIGKVMQKSNKDIENLKYTKDTGKIIDIGLDISKNILREILGYLKSENKYIEVSELLILKKVGNEFEYVPSLSEKPLDREYSILINSNNRIDKKYIDENKKIIEELFKKNIASVENQYNEAIAAIKDEKVINMFKDIIKIFKNNDVEIKSINFINEDKVFVVAENKILNIIMLSNKIIKKLINNKNDLNINDIIDDAISKNEYLYQNSITFFEKENNEWKFKVPEYLEKIKQK